MVFSHFEHKADIGIRGIGESKEEAFLECARALTDVIVNVRTVGTDKKEIIEVSASDEGALLAAFLNQLLFLKDTKKLIFSSFSIHITGQKGKITLRAKAAGTLIDPKKHSFKVDVKAATYTQLEVKEEHGKWIAQCVVDV